ncbi:unnamed protein product [Caenorhabditis bovis]|uniref:Uncharacterized protein n=1 Tax=Caenorhabditis bovis TaxID=2654633 RepID=A0A8S1EYE2_9PELO|nr:unnamed protein product [Caenorhabditis bovis]
MSKHAATKSALFSSPVTPKAKRFANADVVLNATKFQEAIQENAAKIAETTPDPISLKDRVEPMEIDETSGDEPCSTAKTPKRRSIPAFAKRKSICLTFAEAENDKVKEMSRMVEAAHEYRDFLKSQIDKFDEIDARSRRRLERARLRAASEFVTSRNSTQKVPNIHEIMTTKSQRTEIDALNEALINFRKLTVKNVKHAALQAKYMENEKKIEKEEKKLEALRKLHETLMLGDDEREQIRQRKATIEENARMAANLLGVAREMASIALAPIQII